MSDISANDLADGSAKVTSWIPQVYFDLIARVVPGSLGLLVLGISFVGVHEWFSLVGNLLDRDLGFPSVLLILLTIFGVSYSYAVCVFGLWYGGFGLWLRVIKANLKTYAIVLDNEEFATLYEEKKANNPAAGNRLTKLKAEIHMAGTLIASGILSFLIISVQSIRAVGSIWYNASFLLVVFVAIVGLHLAVRHFATRSTQIANYPITGGASGTIQPYATVESKSTEPPDRPTAR